ncbi:MAG: hypothetical protein AB1665_08510, partial [Candidatus Thermoplasmatota archaeon]
MVAEGRKSVGTSYAMHKFTASVVSIFLVMSSIILTTSGWAVKREGQLTADISPPIMIVQIPNGGEIWKGGSQQTIEWSATDDVGFPPNPISLYYSINTGIDWTLIASSEPNDGTYTWTLPTPTSDDCLVRVNATDTSGNTGSDVSNSTFIIDSTLPFVKVQKPNGGEVWKGGSIHYINWTMWDNYAAPPNTISIYYSINNGIDWTLIAQNESNDGTYSWNVPFVTSDDCLVRINATDTAGNPNSDVSDTLFTIDSSPPFVKVERPNGGEVWKGGSTQYINWTMWDNYASPPNTISIYYSINAGLNWTLIAQNESNDGTYPWTVPMLNSQECLIKINASDTAGNMNSDESDALFTIDSTPPTIAVTSPDGGELWKGGAQYNITWLAYDNYNLSATPITIYYSIDNGTNWTLIASSEPNDGSYMWTTPLVNSTLCIVRVEVRDAADILGSDVSNSTFAIDSANPVSSVVPLTPYWQNANPLVITASASDSEGSGLTSVELWYRFSLDNATWSAWTLFSTDTAAPWSWDFTWPSGEGYYEFYTRARDNAGNYEAAPGSADARCAYDASSPLTSNLSVEPNPAYVGTHSIAWLNATIGSMNNGSRIVQAEWYLLNSSFAPEIPNGTGTPMSPTDGAWSTSLENVTASINIGGWTALGTYDLWVHGMDEAGNWGAWAKVTLVRESGATKLAYIPPITVMTAGTQITFTIQAQNETGAPANVGEDIVVYLYTTSTVGEFRNVGTGIVITQVTILAGTNSTQVDYYDTDAMNDPYTLTANSNKLDNGTASVTVEPDAIDYIIVTPNPATVEVGTLQQFDAIAYDQFDNEIADAAFVWTSNVGTVDTNGLFTAQTSPGAGVVNATNGTVTGSASVNVVVGGIDHIIVTPNPSSIVVGESQQFTATAYDV